MVSSFTLIAALGALPLAFAGYGAEAASGTHSQHAESTSAPGLVKVGANGLKFEPDTITANVGDEITFQFFPKNHSVVQADFNNPCNPKDGGIFSGAINTTEGPSDRTFKIKVQDDKPIWLYCGALLPTPHCAEGMVAVINPPKEGERTLDAFRAAAQDTNTSTVPTKVNGGEVLSGVPVPSGTGSADPSESSGAASQLTFNAGAAGGVLALFAGLML